MTNVNNERIINSVKQWITPGLISLVGMMIWAQLSELKSDVKTLLINQGVTETRISVLEKEVDYIKNNRSYASNFSTTFRDPNTRAVPKKEDGPQIPDPECSEDMRKKSY